MFQEPFLLERSVICCEQDWGGAGRDWETDYFEIQEFGSKDCYVFKVGQPEMENHTKRTSQCLVMMPKSEGKTNVFIACSLFA